MSRFSPMKTYVPWYLVANPRSSDTHRSCHGNVATLAFERKKRARNYDDIYSSLLCQEQQFLEFWALILHLPTMIPPLQVSRRDRECRLSKKQSEIKRDFHVCIFQLSWKKFYLASGCDNPYLLGCFYSDVQLRIESFIHIHKSS